MRSPVAQQAARPKLICPDCAGDPRLVGASHRIGNRRRDCPVCNNWVQAVRREIFNRLCEQHPGDVSTLRLRVERDLYVELVKDWNAANPPIEEMLATERESWVTEPGPGPGPAPMTALSDSVDRITDVEQRRAAFHRHMNDFPSTLFTPRH
jgi:hypothetical protein